MGNHLNTRKIVGSEYNEFEHLIFFFHGVSEECYQKSLNIQQCCQILKHNIKSMQLYIVIINVRCVNEKLIKVNQYFVHYVNKRCTDKKSEHNITAIQEATDLIF